MTIDEIKKQIEFTTGRLKHWNNKYDNAKTITGRAIAQDVINAMESKLRILTETLKAMEENQ